MNSLLTLNEIINLSETITGMCGGILLRNGPFLKEGVYQDLLVHELQRNSMVTTRELVFPYRMIDSEGERLMIGNSQSLRSDIELPAFQGILELKSSGSATKDENLFQLRNYLENRPDRSWGLLVNFISKFTQNTGAKVQVSLLVKGDENHKIRRTDNGRQDIFIHQYYRKEFESQTYPLMSELFMSFEEENLQENDTEQSTSTVSNLVESGVLNLN